MLKCQHQIENHYYTTTNPKPHSRYLIPMPDKPTIKSSAVTSRNLHRAQTTFKPLKLASSKQERVTSPCPKCLSIHCSTGVSRNEAQKGTPRFWKPAFVLPHIPKPKTLGPSGAGSGCQAERYCLSNRKMILANLKAVIICSIERRVMSSEDCKR